MALPPEQRPNVSQPIIEIVEDDQSTRLFLADVGRLAAEELGIEEPVIREVTTVAELKTSLEGPKLPHLVFLDLQLGPNDWPVTLDAVRQAREREEVRPVVFIGVSTVPVNSQIREAIAQAGLAAFIEKPFNPDDFHKIVEQTKTILRQVHTEQSAEQI